MEDQNTKRFNELIQKKINLTQDLLALASEQSQISYIDNPQTYENLVQSREMIIEDIKKVDVLIRSEIDTVSAKTGTNDLTGQYERANAVISELAKQILVLDEKSKSSMSKELQKIAERIEALHKGKKGLNGYNSAGSMVNLGGAYTDSKR
jgi:hypothetical protein